MNANITKTGISLPKVKTITFNGKEYEFDVSDIDVIEGISADYPQILRRIGEGQKMEAELKQLCSKIGVEKPETATLGDVMNNLDNADDETEASFKVLAAEITQCNRDIIQLCKAMIEGCLGEKEYQELTNGKKNIAIHTAICGGLFAEANIQRDKIVNDAAEMSEKLQNRYGN